MAPWITNRMAQLSLCSDGSYCPRDNTGPNTTCCDNHQGQQAKNGGATIAASVVSSIQAAATETSSTMSSGTSSSTSPTQSSSSSATSSTSTSASSSTSVSPSPSASASTSSSPPSSPPSSNNAWIAGVVIGPIAAIALVIVAFHFLRRGKRSGPYESPVIGEKAELHAKSAKLPQELAVETRMELPASESGAGVHVMEMQ